MYLLTITKQLAAQNVSSISLYCKTTRNTFQYFSTSSFWFMNCSLLALSARIYPIVDLEVVGTLNYNRLSGFALKKL